MGNVKMIIVATFALGVSVASADKLSDFEEASAAVDAKKGCDRIPYSEYRSSCKSQNEHIHDWCDGKKGPVTCGSENVTRQVKNNVEKEKKALEELKAKKSRLERDRSSASTDDEKNKIGKEIEQADKDIYEQERRIEQAQKDVETRRKLVEDAIYTIDKCIDYRRAVQNSFDAALDKVRNENETPRLKELANKIANSFQASKPGHETEITEKKNALETCKSSRP